MVFWNCQITCSFCYPPYPDGDRVILLLAAAVKWENTTPARRSGDAAGERWNKFDLGGRVGKGRI